MTVAAIAFGVASLIVSGGFIEDLYRQLAESIIRSQTGHLQIAHPAFFDAGSRSPEKHRIADLTAVEQSLVQGNAVQLVTARLSFVGLLGNGRADQPIIGEGIDADKEATFATALTILSGRSLEKAGPRAILVGEGLAKALKLKPGDDVNLVANTIDGSMNALELVVGGTFRTYSKDYDARAVKVPLNIAQELLDTRDANTIVVMLRDTAHTSAAAESAARAVSSRRLEVRTWRQLNDFYTKTVQFYDRQFSVLTAIILFMVVLGVSNAVNMAVYERTAEFGTMRALGNRSGYAMRLIIVECAVLGFVGAAAGVLLGLALGASISAVGIPMPPPPNSSSGYTATIALVPAVIVESFFVGLLATIIASVIPALRIRRMAIVEALQRAA
jgi:putative ABC transport system permease protein